MPAYPNRRPLRAALAAGVAVLALVASGLFAGSQPAHAAPGQVHGHVFLDFDGDGVFDTGNSASSGIANDTPFANVTVRAYNRHNALVGTAVTGASGNPNYALSLSGTTDGDPLRIEFTLPSRAYDTIIATGARTSVRFVQAGAENVNLGIVRPDDTNRGNPYIATVLQRPGLLTSGPNTSGTTSAAVVLTRWSSSGNAPAGWEENPNCSNNAAYCIAFTDRIVAATVPQVGSTYWTAYDGASRVLYVAANYRRGSALGPGGLGAIYRIQLTFNAAGTLTGTALLSSIDVTASPRSIDLGGSTIQANSARNLGSANVPDPNGFSRTLKVGIGGMAMDADNRILYFVNLFDKRLYALNVDTGARVSPSTGWATNASEASNQRAFGLTLRDGQLYLGSNQTGEDRPFCPAASPGPTYLDVSNAAAGCGGGTAALRAFVDRAPIGAGGAPGEWTNVLNFSLGYTKGSQLYDWGGAPVGNRIATQRPQIARWNTWTDNWSGLNNGTNPAPTARTVAFVADTSGGNWTMPSSEVHLYPQPFVSSISIDAAGYLTVGLGDRTALQSGSRQVSSTETNLTNTAIATWETVASGDTLLAAPTGAGSYTIENNGTAGTRTMSSGRTPTPYTGQGPGGAEFYYDRQNLGEGGNHMEASLGATVIAPGVSQVASTFMDPLSPVRVTGLAWFNSTDGDIERGYQQENDAGGDVRSASFQKGGGIGGLSLMLNELPVEIGNRVWYDADLDGIQDADEPAIGGAIVELWADANGDGVPDGSSPLATATTTSATTQGSTVYGATTHNYTGTDPGTFYFRSADSAVGGIPGFTKQGTYVVVFRKPSNTATAVSLAWPAGMPAPPGFAGLTWAQVQLTSAAAAGSTVLNDSNPNPTTGRASVAVGGGSENDHTIDAGWFGLSSYRIQKTVVGTPASGQVFTIDVESASNFRGDDIRGAGAPPSDPIVDTLSYELTAGQTLTTTERVPYGTVLTFREPGVPGASVAFTPAQPGDNDVGRIVVAPTAVGSEVLVQATNSLTAITIAKALSQSAALPPGTTFPIEYTVDGGPTQTAEVAADATLTLAGIPWDAVVRIREPLEGPFSWGGYAWSSGTWAQGATTLTPDAEGWITVTAPSSTTPLALTLTNHPYVPPALPFAGGLASDLFLILGGLVTAAALGLGVFAFTRRGVRRVPVHRV